MTRKEKDKDDKAVKDKVSTMMNKQKKENEKDAATAVGGGGGGGAVIEVEEEKVTVDVEEDTTAEGEVRVSSVVSQSDVADSGASTVTTTTSGTATSRAAGDTTTRTTTTATTNNDSGGHRANNEVAALAREEEEEQLVVAELVTSDGMTTIAPTTTGSDDGDDVIDDPDLEARIRDQILQEGGEAQIIKIEKHDNKGSSGAGGRSSSSKTKMITLILSLLFLLIVIIIGILVGNVLPSRLANKNKNNNADGGSYDAEKTRREELVDLLLPLYGEKDYTNETGIDFFLSFLGDVDDGQDEVDNIMDDVVTNLPQYKAFQWMVNIDEFDLKEVYENNSNALNPNNDYDLYLSKLLERYVLAVLYYATDGDNSWKDKTNFLTVTSSVCEWNGSHNDNDDEQEQEENENGDNIINNTIETISGAGDAVVEVENDPFATIPGVECDDRTGQVTKIRLGKR